ncbi:MAG: aminopeptidase P family protein [Sarcina sp.]
MMGSQKIRSLRGKMEENNIDYYIITSSDAHQSEYVCEYYKGREYISEFTGSAGTLLISMDKAILWTDGRYFIQAEHQLKNSGIELYKVGVDNYDTLAEVLKKSVKENETIGFDGRTVSTNMYKELKRIVSQNNGKLAYNMDLLEEIWRNRKSIPRDKVFIHDEKFCGRTIRQKVEDILLKMQEIEVDSYIIASLDDIAWTLNLRGNDVLNTPVFMSFLLVTRGSITLYIKDEKLSQSVCDYLAENGVNIKNYDEIIQDVSILEGKVLINPNKVNSLIFNNININAIVEEQEDLTAIFKAIKNKVEVENIENSQIRDGVAMVKFIKWLKENIDKEKITEISAADKLEKFRSEGEYYKGLSFDTIAAYKEHVAMMHYKAEINSAYELKKEGMFLVDSGAQYLDGTTDITRTIVLGELTKEEKINFTLVLKGHINLMKIKFLKGTSGKNLDIKAREFLWNEGIDYKCGTGHGIGFMLSVHEGPQGINSSNNVILEEGMLLTNEPGVYKKDEYGIRLENTMLVENYKNTSDGEFLNFRVVSYCPIDIKGIDTSILTSEEKFWINKYHQLVYSKLKPYLSIEEREFLSNEIKEII